ncbi:MAG: nucleotide sugar dehydrogenase [Saprospiraceae bacterium]|jgi:UDP-N-acetyl-D-galactosamine dehydrogenase|nr:nucleotide sugar dehydrogenase [Candidatus Defluviibacterium haderslevense]MBK7242352.1 nucleotide sugar dehydrogenase [Candidatus Defluviibacterium haderslevense]
MYQDLLEKKKSIAVVGLGYVGLPLALVFAKKFKVIGFDINQKRIDMMKNKIDPSKELLSSAFENVDIEFTTSLDILAKASFYIVAVPTPVDEHKVPDLKPILGASHTVGKALKKGDYVVYESTVYPGCTEEDCKPVLELESGLTFGPDFKLGYSPERINPGDKERTVEHILKIVSGSDPEATEEVAKVYSAIIKAGIYKATSIKVAEAAKVIENTQRDLNISFMNELSIIFDRMGIDTREVLEAAGTKWNFLKFYPGLVGGHCIGVDPYYLLHKSKELGYDPEVILSGRRINDQMPAFVAKKLVQLLISKDKNLKQCKVLILGITFKENVSDIRNSKVADLYYELAAYSIKMDLVDSFACSEEVLHEYNIQLKNQIESNYDAVVVAVAHDEYKHLTIDDFKKIMNINPILIDLKGIYQRPDDSVHYWRL